jgi:predicted ATPase
MGLPGGTVTFLFTDIEGSTRLLQRMGPERYGEALAAHRRLLRQAFAAEGGVEVDTQGDAFFVAFPTVSGAAVAARNGHSALAAGPITVRMGLHTGTPVLTDEGYVGIDVHRGARIAALAHGGQVIISAATADLLTDEPLRDLGRHRLKDFDAPAQLYQLGPGEFPPLRTPGAVDLPVHPTAFLGRSRELYEAVSAWLDRDPRVLTIVGPGGTGKTRFSVELARVLADQAAGGTVFVALAAVRDAQSVVPLIADRLGAAGPDLPAIAARVGGKRTHVVLDNLEQLLPKAARPLADLLAAVPSLRILATSREPLRIAGECEFDLPPMDEPEAVALFLARAAAVRAGTVDSPAVHELVRRLDGLPLAVELAAARVKLLGPEQILKRIAQRLDLLKGGRDADERHATLRATIAWSHDLLDEEERQLFARLAVFRGGWSLAAAEEVCQCDLDTLASLLDKSLIRRRTQENGDERFTMLETIREFATECLRACDEEDPVRQRQAEWLIGLAVRAGTRGTLGFLGRWDLDAVTPEMDNVRAVLEWAQRHQPGQGLMLAAYFEAFWVVREPAEGASWLEPLLAAANDADPLLRGHALRALGAVCEHLGDYERAAIAYEQSLEAATGSGDAAQLAYLRYRVASCLIDKGGDAAAYGPMLAESLRTFRELGYRGAEAEVLGALAGIPYAQGDVQRAIDLTLESARVALQDGWRFWAGMQLNGAATLELERGNLDAVQDHARAALDLDLQIDANRGALACAAKLALVAAERGQAERAGRLWGAIESEQESRPVPRWERIRAQCEDRVLRADGDTFARARADGRLLSIAQAAGLDG